MASSQRGTYKLVGIMLRSSFRTVLLRTLAALALGTVVFVVIVILLQIPRFAEDRGEGQGDSNGARWAGDELQALGLNAGVREGAVWLPASETTVRGVVTTGPISLEAATVDVLRVHAPGLHPATGVRVFWRTSAAPEAFESLPLEMTRGGRIALGMNDVAAWSGVVTEVGLLLTGPVPEPVTVRYIEAEPLTPGSLWPVLWTQWRSFLPWKQASVNFLNVSRGTYLSPVVAAAMWIVLVWVCYRLLAGRQLWNWRWAFSIFLVAWILLDLRFQSDLLFKLRETRFNYAGKSVEARLASGPDAVLYEAVRHFLDQVDTSNTRVFVLTDEPAAVRAYKRHRVHYYLLPVNAFSGMRQPPSPDQLVPGDVIFIVGPHGRVHFNNARSELVWRDDQRVGVSRLYVTGNAAAYRVEDVPG